ncbi:hypothetical protein B9Z55_015120 [Caenorhabditis nigoni]|uniref:Peptidase S1 domain-containing protein n=1 Tax=Caenorhabditis nigoni TaxID=1611254 RepID=A0A2G5U8S5_9PELO|nr:hypothetical protein B9Z55_015120 [Caenorhabditis nigoni]
MNRLLFLLFFFLFGGIWCDHRLSSEENMYLKSYCGTEPDLPSSEEHQSLEASCGTKPKHPRRFKSESIAGGTPIPGNEAPWAAKIQYPGSSCSSTIISPRHIMSASHCLMSNVTHYAHRFNRIRNECSLYFEWGNFQSKVIDYLVSGNPNLQAMNTVVKATAYGHDNWDTRNTNGQGTSMLRSGCFQITESRDRSYDELWFIVDGKRWGVEARKGDSGGSLIHYANTQFHLIGVISHSWDTSMLAASSVSAHYTRICHHTGIC